MFVVFALPLLLVLVVLRVKEVSFNAKSLYGGVIIGAVSMSLCWGLLHLNTRQGVEYISVLEANSSYLQMSEWQSLLERFLRFFVNFFLTPQQYFHRAFAFPAGDLFSFAPSLAAQWEQFQQNPIAIFMLGLLLTLGVFLWTKDRKSFSWLLLLTGASLLALIAVAMVRHSWGGHHVIFAHLILATGLAWTLFHCHPKCRIVVAIVLVTYNLLPSYFIFSAPNRQILAHSTQSRFEVFDYVDEPAFASNHMTVHLNWGTYYLDALFGPKDQLVVYVDPFNESAHFDYLQKQATSLHRKLAFLGLSDTSPGWSSFLERHSFKRGALSRDGLWSVWEE
jgi:hypothetical protein